MSTFSSKPSANPRDGTHGADDVQLHRTDQPTHLWSGAFGEAWELVKQKPVETLLLSFLWLMFNGGGSFNFPSGGGSSSSGTDDTDWSSRSDYGGMFVDAVGDFVARISAFEMALIGGLIALVLTFAVIGLVLGTLVRGGATIFWLRHVRGQDATLGHTPRVISFFVPLLFATLASTVAIFFGVLALIIPGIVLALGFTFVNQVVVDKNMGWFEALRASWRLADGYKIDLFLFAIVCGLLNFVGLLACCIGIVVTNAVVMGASVIVYDRIAAPGNAYLLDEPAPPQTDATAW